MSLGHVFLIYGGNAEDRASIKDRLVEEHSLQYPYWTETFDSTNGNTAVVFGTNYNDAWSVKLKDIYDNIMGKNSNDSGKISCIPMIQKIEARENAGGISCKQASMHTMTFGGCLYP